MIRRAWVPAIAGVVLVGVAIAHAAIPASGGVIHACYKPNGELRVVDDPASCKSSELPLAWSQVGPQGVQGLPGPQGPQGPEGPQGPPGTPGSGSSDFYASYNDIGVSSASGPVETGGGQEIVGLSDLSPGTYWITATINLGQFDLCLTCSDAVVHCTFVDAVGEFLNPYQVDFGDRGFHDQVIYPLTAIRTYANATNTIRVRCDTDRDAHAYGEITAIKVNPLGVK